MRKALLSITLISTIAALFVVSCSKTYNRGTATKSLNQMFAGLRSTPQNLSVTAGRDTVVFGADSTVFHFYTNSFKDASGNIITSGTVNLQLVEIYKPADFISNRTTTSTSDGHILQSGGEINLVATMNGQTVYANRYDMGFKQTNSSTTTMNLYYGATNSADSNIK